MVQPLRTRTATMLDECTGWDGSQNDGAETFESVQADVFLAMHLWAKWVGKVFAIHRSTKSSTKAAICRCSVQEWKSNG